MEEAVLLVLDLGGRLLNFVADMNTPREVVESLSKLGYGAYKALNSLSAIVGLGDVHKLSFEVEGLTVTVTQQGNRVIVVAHKSTNVKTARSSATAEA
ncbi:hypothetical protein WLZ34_05515 [Thermogladius sp. KZ2Tp1]|uniref:hypothetical protein n=1 Tax=unclassified Thermogladius TaxID=2647734 RepID=UPI003D0B9A4D